MPNFLRCTVIGHAGGDADARYLPSGDQVSNFSIAYTEKWTDKSSGEKKEQTTWFNVACFGKLAEVASQYVKKGGALMVEGRPYVEQWQGRDGAMKATLKLRADRIVLLGRAGDGERQEAQTDARQHEQQREPAKTAAPAASSSDKPRGHFDDMEDDIPF